MAQIPLIDLTMDDSDGDEQVVPEMPSADSEDDSIICVYDSATDAPNERDDDADDEVDFDVEFFADDANIKAEIDSSDAEDAHDGTHNDKSINLELESDGGRDYDSDEFVNYGWEDLKDGMDSRASSEISVSSQMDYLEVLEEILERRQTRSKALGKKHKQATKKADYSDQKHSGRDDDHKDFGGDGQRRDGDPDGGIAC